MVGYIGASVVGLSTVSADIDGTVTADALTVDGQSVLNKNYAFQTENYHVKIGENSGDSYIGSFGNGHFVASGYYYGSNQYQLTGGTTNLTGYSATSDFTIFAEDGLTANSLVTKKNRLSIDGATGDISFYEDTGTTAKFFWDASVEGLGIGNTSFTNKLNVTGAMSSAGTPLVQLSENSGSARDGLYLDYTGTTNSAVYSLKIADATKTHFAVRGDGNVGIGVSSPSAGLHIDNPSNSAITAILDTDNSAVKMVFRNTSETGNNLQIGADGSNLVAFTNGSERMRIDSSGRLLIGHTTANGYALDVAKANLGAAGFNRTGSDGEIVAFMKDGSTVGSLQSISGIDLAIAGNRGSTGTGIRFTDFELFPITKSGATNDNFIDVGHSAARYDDIYATNGTIQTSDENEKQQIASLTDAEITAAKAISKLFKTFKWNDKVEAKGDAARTHTGVIAQQVETAMSDAGLDAGNYAFFISTTWWETQTEVAAVEAVEAQDAVYEDVVIPAVEEVLDEDGNVVTEAQPERTEQRLVSEAVEAVEAQEAYTRTDTYNTQEEAPEGATERNRKGIRYPELLSFIGAATEQRLTSIEARLDALEAN